jgi:hypothetical protein
LGGKSKVGKCKISEYVYFEINNGRVFDNTLGNATLIMTKSYKHTNQTKNIFASFSGRYSIYMANNGMLNNVKTIVCAVCGVMYKKCKDTSTKLNNSQEQNQIHFAHL